MPSRHLPVVACLLSFTSLVPAYARAQACSTPLASVSEVNLDRSGCECGKPLANIALTSPGGLRLVAACSLSWDGVGKIDLTKTRLALDGQGPYPLGQLYFAGPIELSGTVWRNITDSSEMGFASDAGFDVSWRATGKKPGFSEQIRSLQFEDAATRQALKLDSALTGKLAGKTCALATARIRVQGVKWVNSDTDDQGAFALGTQVLEVSAYRACPARWRQRRAG